MVLMMLPSALLRLCSAALTPLESAPKFATNAASPEPPAGAFPTDAAPGEVTGLEYDAAEFPLMLLIDIATPGSR